MPIIALHLKCGWKNLVPYMCVYLNGRHLNMEASLQISENV